MEASSLNPSPIKSYFKNAIVVLGGALFIFLVVLGVALFIDAQDGKVKLLDSLQDSQAKRIAAEQKLKSLEEIAKTQAAQSDTVSTSEKQKVLTNLIKNSPTVKTPTPEEQIQMLQALQNNTAR